MEERKKVDGVGRISCHARLESHIESNPSWRPRLKRVDVGINRRCREMSGYTYNNVQ